MMRSKLCGLNNHIPGSQNAYNDTPWVPDSKRNFLFRESLVPLVHTGCPRKKRNRFDQEFRSNQPK